MGRLSHSLVKGDLHPDSEGGFLSRVWTFVLEIVEPQKRECKEVTIYTMYVRCIIDHFPFLSYRHYPKQSFTTVADTPENLRLKQQSELQSQVTEYIRPIPQDRERFIQRIKSNCRIIARRSDYSCSLSCFMLSRLQMARPRPKWSSFFLASGYWVGIFSH